MRSIQCCFALLFLALVIPAFSSAQDDNTSNSIAFQRAQHLQHGINTSLWFAQANDYSVHRLQTFTTPADIALIAKMGFDHCRLSIDAGPLVAWQQAGKPTDFMTELDRVVK